MQAPSSRPPKKPAASPGTQPLPDRGRVRSSYRVLKSRTGTRFPVREAVSLTFSKGHERGNGFVAGAPADACLIDSERALGCAESSGLTSSWAITFQRRFDARLRRRFQIPGAQ